MTTFLEEDGRCPQTPRIDPTRADTPPRCSGRDGKGGRVARLWPGGPRATALRWASGRTQVWPAPNRDDGSLRPVRFLFSLRCQAADSCGAARDQLRKRFETFPFVQTNC